MPQDYASFHMQDEALYNRTIRTRLPDGFATLLYVQQGRLRWDDQDGRVDGPALCYWPQSQRPSLSIDAGTRAIVLGLGDVLMSDAIGARAESVHLRMLIEQPFQVILGEPGQVVQVEALLDWFQDEVSVQLGQSPMTLAAYIRLLFIRALRLHRPDRKEEGAEFTSILHRFRHLVELHFREHWLVSQYADALSVDYDRLHRICKRETGRTPAELVHERLTAEAKARLEKSGLPVKKIATDLGFADATRFSHFFKRRTDMSPGAYRAIVSRPDGENIGALKQSFADWP